MCKKQLLVSIVLCYLLYQVLRLEWKGAVRLDNGLLVFLLLKMINRDSSVSTQL